MSGWPTSGKHGHLLILQPEPNPCPGVQTRRTRPGWWGVPAPKYQGCSCRTQRASWLGVGWREFLSGYGSCGNAGRRLGAGPLPHPFLPLTVSIWYDFLSPFLPLIKLLSFNIISSQTLPAPDHQGRLVSLQSDPGWTKLRPRGGHLATTVLCSTRKYSMTLGHETGGQPRPGNQGRGERLLGGSLTGAELRAEGKQEWGRAGCV